jgi:predicted flap endonuclease-1-like 5' DNA nuclease
MLQTIEANWVAFALALVIGLLVAWWLFGRGSRGSRERSYAPDVLDEGAAPAQRNQALIDQPSAVRAASFADTGPDIMGGIGEVFAAAATSEVVDAEPAAEAPPPAAPPSPAFAATGDADDLRKIKGVGPKLVALLQSLGVTTFAQVAAWTDADIDRIDAQLGTFAGRIRRDSWVEQAKFLAAGDTTGFEGKFGKL